MLVLAPLMTSRFVWWSPWNGQCWRHIPRSAKLSDALGGGSMTDGQLFFSVTLLLPNYWTRTISALHVARIAKSRLEIRLRSAGLISCISVDW